MAAVYLSASVVSNVPNRSLEVCPTMFSSPRFFRLLGLFDMMYSLFCLISFNSLLSPINMLSHNSISSR